VDLVALLLARGADVHYVDHLGRTALTYMLRGGGGISCVCEKVHKLARGPVSAA
jgi:hypothetical protein